MVGHHHSNNHVCGVVWGWCFGGVAVEISTATPLRTSQCAFVRVATYVACAGVAVDTQPHQHKMLIVELCGWGVGACWVGVVFLGFGGMWWRVGGGLRWWFCG